MLQTHYRLLVVEHQDIKSLYYEMHLIYRVYFIFMELFIFLIQQVQILLRLKEEKMMMTFFW